MSATKITGLDPITYMSSGDLVPVVHNPAGSPTTNKITIDNFYSNVAVAVSFANTFTVSGNVVSQTNLTANNLFLTYKTTPVSSGDVVLGGKIWFDSNYIYVAIANNTIKRVALASF